MSPKLLLILKRQPEVHYLVLEAKDSFVSLITNLNKKNNACKSVMSPIACC